MNVGSKPCYRCRREKPSSAFIQKRNGTSYDMCSGCLSQILTTKYRPPKKRLPHTAITRVCYMCRRELPNAAFTKLSNGTFFWLFAVLHGSWRELEATQPAFPRRS